MLAESATNKQLEYLTSLAARTGAIVPDELTKTEASALIEELLAKSPKPAAQSGSIRIRATDLPKEGTFTVVGPRGGHRTLRFRVGIEGFFAGKTVIGYLSGPDNESAYTGFAHIDGDWVKVWSRYTGAADIIAALKFLAQGRSVWEKAGEAYALESGHCFRCSRTLTTPVSLNRGLGPECAKILGGAA